MIAEYPQQFKDLLDNYRGTSPDNYIGQGNPGAKILIIGKECTAKNDKHDEERNFYTFETERNFEKWKENEREEIDFYDVPDWDTCSLRLEEKYNPLSPYNSWVYGGRKGHGSKTWDGYQTIFNHIFPDKQVQKGEHYNFFQYCFLTELSTNNMSTSKRNAQTAQSVHNRLQDPSGILRQDFFQQFPIIILACYQYKDWYHIDIEDCFNQHYVGTPFDNKVGRTNEFIHEHRNGNRLLLHTNHAVYNGIGLHSVEYYQKLGEICREFLQTL